MHRILTVVAIACSASMVEAQAPGLHPEKQRIQKEILKERDAIRHGAVQKFNVRVRVRLHNGSKLIGVVKGGRFVEQEHGIDFVEADRTDPDAGVRLWYFDDSNSFIFLRWVDVESHKVLAKLTDEEVRLLELEVTARDEKRAQERRLAAEAKAKADAEAKAKAETEGGKPAVDSPPAAPGGADPAPIPVPALLAEFPPKDGWSEERAAELERRKVVVGVFPNAQEQRFLDVLAEWKKARDDYAAKTGKKDEPAPAPKPKSEPVKK